MKNASHNLDSEPDRLDHMAAALGFRRVERVEITIRRGHVAAEVTGVSHRYPRTVPVPLRSARRLIDAGAPSRMTHVE